MAPSLKPGQIVVMVNNLFSHRVGAPDVLDAIRGGFVDVDGLQGGWRLFGARPLANSSPGEVVVLYWYSSRQLHVLTP